MPFSLHNQHFDNLPDDSGGTESRNIKYTWKIVHGLKLLDLSKLDNTNHKLHLFYSLCEINASGVCVIVLYFPIQIQGEEDYNLF